MLAMYQSRRDVDIMAIQRGMSRAQAAAVGSSRRLQVLVDDAACAHARDAAAFDDRCTVRRDFARERATCTYRPRAACHVKDATMAIGRMGDMGKLATSAWLHVADAGGLRTLPDDRGRVDRLARGRRRLPRRSHRPASTGSASSSRRCT